ncbi:MAG: DNA polymerase III subunit chi [Betaproteobacteria bacterium]|nr:DNA polymerase III subunit chi [Betaproteobacteria bacterium]
MTIVHFYHNADDLIGLVCELVGNAHRSGRKAVIVSPDTALAQRLDRELWTADPGGFIPHVMNGSPLAAETPIVIGFAGEKEWPHTDLLFNLAPELPAACERFRMLIEIVGRNETQRAPARARWMHYKQQQFPLKAFDAERRIAL